MIALAFVVPISLVLITADVVEESCDASQISEIRIEREPQRRFPRHSIVLRRDGTATHTTLGFKGETRRLEECEYEGKFASENFSQLAKFVLKQRYYELNNWYPEPIPGILIHGEIVSTIVVCGQETKEVHRFEKPNSGIVMNGPTPAQQRRLRKDAIDAKRHELIVAAIDDVVKSIKWQESKED